MNKLINSIVIFDALPDNESGAVRRLHEDLEQIAVNHPLQLHIERFPAKTPHDIELSTRRLLDKVRIEKWSPLIHFEAHGFADESGLSIGQDIQYSWKSLKQAITPLNIATGLNLPLVLASCYGGSFAREMDITDIAPIWWLIGPKRKVSATKLETDFSTFYQRVLLGLDTKRAVQELRNGTSDYYLTTAEFFFYEVWSGYKRTLCSKEAIEMRARRIYRDAIRENVRPLPSIGHIKRTLRNREEAVFCEFRDKYFMFESVPKNKERFPVTYQAATEFLEKYNK